MLTELGSCTGTCTNIYTLLLCYMQMIQVLRTIGLRQKGDVFGLPQKGEVLYADVTNVTHKC